MRLLLLAMAVAAVLLLGCLQEKELNTQNIPTGQPSGTAQQSTTPTATGTTTATPTPTPTPTATPTPTPSPTTEAGGTCIINTPHGSTDFAAGESISIFAVFTDLPLSVANVRIVNCGDGSDVTNPISRQGNSVFARQSCLFNPSSTRSYTITVTAGSATCSIILTITPNS